MEYSSFIASILLVAAVPQNETAPVANATHLQEQTTLIPNEAEAFALEPIDVTSMGMEKRAKRKRKLVIDEQKGIPSETMKNQLANTQEIIGTLDLAPPSKKLMLWKETGGVEKLFALPGRAIATKKIMNVFERNNTRSGLTWVVHNFVLSLSAADVQLQLHHARLRRPRARPDGGLWCDAR